MGKYPILKTIADVALFFDRTADDLRERAKGACSQGEYLGCKAEAGIWEAAAMILRNSKAYQKEN